MIYTDLGDVPTGAFEIIYADPAWAFKTWSKKLVVPQTKTKQHYEVMSREELQALRVSEIAAKNCILFMWITASNLPEGLELGRAWGFEFKTKVFSWVKIKIPDHMGQFGFYPPEISPRMGLGRWSRQESEDCYLFMRGKIPRLSGGVRQMIFEPRRQHSRKPDCTRDRIIQLVGDRPRIELFSRRNIPGWSAWGLEAGKYDGL